MHDAMSQLPLPCCTKLQTFTSHRGCCSCNGGHYGSRGRSKGLQGCRFSSYPLHKRIGWHVHLGEGEQQDQRLCQGRKCCLYVCCRLRAVLADQRRRRRLRQSVRYMRSSRQRLLRLRPSQHLLPPAVVTPAPTSCRLPRSRAPPRSRATAKRQRGNRRSLSWILSGIIRENF